MNDIKMILYRYLTEADYYNLYKPRNSEKKGGGQKYVDFPTRTVNLDAWNNFFAGTKDLTIVQKTAGNKWIFPLYSVGGGNQKQTFHIYQRRKNSVCIPNQHIYSKSEKRITAWRPENGFPEPKNNSDRHQLPSGLVVYLISTYSGKIFASWFLNNELDKYPCKESLSKTKVKSIFVDTTPGRSGYIEFKQGELFLDCTDIKNSFFSEIVNDEKEDEKSEVATRTLFDEDDLTSKEMSPEIKTKAMKVRMRNARSVKKLKELYNGKCQISGDKYSFVKKNGETYSEAHHLIPLGDGGFDNPQNIIIISPLLHRMLHHASVGEINLNAVKPMADGSAILDIFINGSTYTITWAPGHARLVLDAEK